MKIAIFSPSIDITNGWGNFTFEFCQHLRGILDFTVYLPQKEKEQNTKFDFPVKFTLPPFLKDFKKRDSHLPYISPLEIHKTDLIHSIASFPYAILAYYTAKQRGIPYIAGIHGGYGIRPLLRRPERKYLKEAYLNADFLYAVSSFLANLVNKKTGKEVKVLHPGVNFRRFQENLDLSELREKFGQGPIILTVGRIQARKGQDIGLKAFKIVKKYFPSSKFLLVGEDQWDGYLQKLINKLKLKDVYIIGEKTGRELVKYYQLCDIFVHVPKLVKQKIEGFGIIYLEAGACGKPIIGSLSGGVSDAVENNVTGLLVPEENANATAKAIIKLLKDRNLAKYLGENGKKNAGSLQWENHVDIMKKNYERILK